MLVSTRFNHTFRNMVIIPPSISLKPTFSCYFQFFSLLEKPSPPFLNFQPLPATTYFQQLDTLALFDYHTPLRMCRGLSLSGPYFFGTEIKLHNFLDEGQHSWLATILFWLLNLCRIFNNWQYPDVHGLCQISTVRFQDSNFSNVL